MRDGAASGSLSRDRKIPYAVGQAASRLWRRIWQKGNPQFTPQAVPMMNVQPLGLFEQRPREISRAADQAGRVTLSLLCSAANTHFSSVRSARNWLPSWSLSRPPPGAARPCRSYNLSAETRDDDSPSAERFTGWRDGARATPAPRMADATAYPQGRPQYRLRTGWLGESLRQRHVRREGDGLCHLGLGARAGRLPQQGQARATRPESRLLVSARRPLPC